MRKAIIIGIILFLAAFTAIKSYSATDTATIKLEITVLPNPEGEDNAGSGEEILAEGFEEPAEGIAPKKSFFRRFLDGIKNFFRKPE